MPEKVRNIEFGKDFPKRVGGRYRVDGPFSGELFREEILEPAFANHDAVVIFLDGLEGYSSSFLEESFGGLVRRIGSYALVAAKLRFVTVERTFLLPTIDGWMRDAEKELLAKKSK